MKAIFFLAVSFQIHFGHVICEKVNTQVRDGKLTFRDEPRDRKMVTQTEGNRSTAGPQAAWQEGRGHRCGEMGPDSGTRLVLEGLIVALRSVCPTL